MSLHIVILAAGQGKRMRSSLPKVLHPLAGMPMLARVIDTALKLKPQDIHVIYGHGGEALRTHLPHVNVNWVFQNEQLGTGHALMQAMPHVSEDDWIMVLSGDVPLIQYDTLAALVDTAEKNHALTLLTAVLDNPHGLGRIVREPHTQAIRAIVEEKDATDAERRIQEIYSGICLARASDLARWLPKLSNDNAQGEYYLTEIIDMAVKDDVPIMAIHPQYGFEIQGVNNRLQLEQLERMWQKHTAQCLALDGVHFADTARVDIRGQLYCDKDVCIDVNCVFEGQVHVGEGSVIEPNCILRNVRIGARTRILANSVLEDCVLADDCHVGPFARLRLGTQLANACKIGNFVETKKAVFGQGSKASHLSYLGDVTIGKDVNIGAGTITCNYDGVNKHQTIIEDGAFIGSDTQLVAPVTVGAGATLGAGTTLRKHAPAGQLTLTEARQKTISGWKRPIKKE